MLNVLWLGFFLVGALSAGVQWLVLGDEQVFSRMVTSLFDMAALSVQIMVVLFGTLTLWLGFLRIAESAGLVNTLARWLGPLFARLMPGVPRGHPAIRCKCVGTGQCGNPDRSARDARTADPEYATGYRH